MKNNIKDSSDELRRNKARNLRYKKALLERLNIDDISDELYEISCACDDMRYFMEDDETLINALDGDEEEEYEFRMMFADLSGNCAKLETLLREEYVTEHFNDFLVGILGNKYRALGYDGYEEDYYHLCGYEGDLASKESCKRLMRLTKEQILSVAAQVFGIAVGYLDLVQTYDYLKATFDILRHENTSYLQIIREIDEAYLEAEQDDFVGWLASTQKYYNLIAQLPDRAWVE